MQILSNASKRFLEPVDSSRIGNAILRLSLPPKDEDKDSADKELPKQFLIEIFDRTDDGQETSPESFHASRFVERRFKHGYRRASAKGTYHPRYYVPATDYTLYLFLHSWTGKREVSESARPLLQQMIDHETAYSSVARRSALYKDRLHSLLNAESEEKKRDPESFMRKDSAFIASLRLSSFLDKKGTFNPNVPEMTIYQKVCATNQIEVPGYSLYKEPGCGKTYPTIAAIDHVVAQTHTIHNRPARILVLVPKNIRHNWVREINHFSRLDLQTTILTGPNATVRTYKLIEALVTEKKGAVVISGYETAAATDNTMLAVEWDLVVIDESHAIANAATKRSKFAIKLRDRARKRILLTGTPIRNTPFDLYTQFEFLHRGGSGLASFNAFKNFFGEWKNIPGKGIRILEELKNIPLLQERLAKYTFLLTKKEAMPSMPAKTYDTLECTLSGEQAQVYKQIATQMAAQLSAVDNTGNGGVPDMMTINSHLTKLLRLAEITSGYAKTDEAGIHRFDPNPKLDTLVEEIKEHLEQDPDSKIQVWCHFRENIKQIRARLNDVEGIPSVVFYGSTSDVDRAEAERKFNTDPNTKVFIGSPSAGGVGLNLLGFDPRNPSAYSTNCDWVIYYSQNWSSTSRRQSEDRAYRKGTRVPIRITDLIVPGSIDDMISERVQSKIDMAMSIQDVQKILSASLNPEVNGI